MRYGSWWLCTTPSRQCSASGCSRRAGPSSWVGITAGTANQWTIQTMTRFYSHHCTENRYWKYYFDHASFAQALRVLRVGWWYFFSKFVDLLDTVFFIMRKKFNQVGMMPGIHWSHLNTILQVSALHVIHHSTLPWLSWWGPRFVGGGHAVFGPFLNSGDHWYNQIHKVLFNSLSRGTHRYVLLLFVCCIWSRSPKVSLVEEIHYNNSAHPVRSGFLPCHSTSFLWM